MARDTSSNCSTTPGIDMARPQKSLTTSRGGAALVDATTSSRTTGSLRYSGGRTTAVLVPCVASHQFVVSSLMHPSFQKTEGRESLRSYIGPVPVSDASTEIPSLLLTLYRFASSTAAANSGGYRSVAVRHLTAVPRAWTCSLSQEIDGVSASSVQRLPRP